MIFSAGLVVVVFPAGAWGFGAYVRKDGWGHSNGWNASSLRGSQEHHEARLSMSQHSSAEPTHAPVDCAASPDDTSEVKRRRDDVGTALKNLRKALSDVHWNGYSYDYGQHLCVFGSYENGFLTRESDLDCTVQLYWARTALDESKELEFLAEHLRLRGYAVLTNGTVLKTKCPRTRTLVPIDLGVNKLSEVANTDLLRKYSENGTIQRLGVRAKTWAKKWNLIDDGVLSSFDMVLLVISWAQHNRLVPRLHPTAGKLTKEQINANGGMSDEQAWQAFLLYVQSVVGGPDAVDIGVRGNTPIKSIFLPPNADVGVQRRLNQCQQHLRDGNPNRYGVLVIRDPLRVEKLRTVYAPANVSAILEALDHEVRRDKVGTAFQNLREALRHVYWDGDEKLHDYGKDLWAFGSYENGFLTRESDLDCTVRLDWARSDWEEWTELQRLAKHLRLRGYAVDTNGTVLKTMCPSARVPIDLGVNKLSEVANTDLLRKYSENGTIQRLGVRAKTWAKKWNLIDDGVLSSFDMVLLVISWAQHNRLVPRLHPTAGKLTKEQIHANGGMSDEQAWQAFLLYVQSVVGGPDAVEIGVRGNTPTIKFIFLPPNADVGVQKRLNQCQQHLRDGNPNRYGVLVIRDPLRMEKLRTVYAPAHVSAILEALDHEVQGLGF